MPRGSRHEHRLAVRMDNSSRVAAKSAVCRQTGLCRDVAGLAARPVGQVQSYELGLTMRKPQKWLLSQRPEPQQALGAIKERKKRVSKTPVFYLKNATAKPHILT